MGIVLLFICVSVSDFLFPCTGTYSRYRSIDDLLLARYEYAGEYLLSINHPTGGGFFTLYYLHSQIQ